MTLRSPTCGDVLTPICRLRPTWDLYFSEIAISLTMPATRCVSSGTGGLAWGCRDMGPLLPTSRSTTTVMETLDHSRSPMLVGIRSREFAASINVDEVYPLLPLAKAKRVQPCMPPWVL
jgi:hypothetical protein